jgi:hypothetical protein
MDESFDAYNAQRLHAADTLLLGPTTYDGFRGFWPSVADDLDATPIQREISRLNNANYRGTFSPDGDTFGGAWHYPGGSAYEATATTRVR